MSILEELKDLLSERYPGYEIELAESDEKNIVSVSIYREPSPPVLVRSVRWAVPGETIIGEALGDLVAMLDARLKREVPCCTKCGNPL